MWKFAAHFTRFDTEKEHNENIKPKQPRTNT